MLDALQLAQLGQGLVEPNPMVGCVLVSHGEPIGTGYHQWFGTAHAERNAVDCALQAGLSDRLRGSTAYVTLEPCCHFGKTPPCCNLLIDIGVRRVVIATQDPFPAVAGAGIRHLRAAGIQVDVGLGSQAAQHLNAPYFKRILTARPWMMAKWAMSLDGRIATRTRHSQWISCQASREVVHQLRGRVDAILVGRGTAVTDDPLLTARLPAGQNPFRKAVRVVVDSELAIDPDSQLARTAHQHATLFWAGPKASTDKLKSLQQLGCRVEICDNNDSTGRLDQLLQFLAGEYSATNVLVEGGQSLLGSLLDLRQIDECHAFIAPKIIGGQSALSPIGGQGFSSVSRGPKSYDVRQQACGDDIHFSCRLDWSSICATEGE